MYIEDAIQTYQCPGCVSGDYPKCFEQGDTDECSNHTAGTNIFPAVGRIFLGLPKGFCRLGVCLDTKIKLFERFEEFQATWGDYDKFNIPVLKHLDKHGNSLVRGLTPRLNYPFIHIILGNALDKINCLEITNQDIGELEK